MSTSPNEHHTSSFPTVPESLSTGGHGMRDYYAEQEHTAQRTAPHTLQDLTPYLGLRARLSQVWINRWTLLILLVLARVLIAIGNLNDDIANAKTEALSACSAVEAMGSTMASMPHYLADGTNELAANGVEKAVDGLEDMLMMTITGVEEIFVFVVNMMYGTYECLITIAVSSAAHAGISVIEDATTSLNNTLSNFNKTVHQDVASFTSDLNSFLSAFNNIGNFFSGGSNQPPTLNLDGPINTLNNYKLPSDITNELNKLNGSIPDFAQVKNATDTLLQYPFEQVKQLINGSLGNYTFDRSVFPTPARQSLTFCSDNDGINDFFDNLYEVADIARKVFIVVMVLAAILACIPMTIKELRSWRTMQRRAALVGQPGLDPMDVVYIVSHPYTATAGLKTSQRFSTPRKQVLTRWFIAYITTTPALLVLAIAVAGLLSALCQYILLKTIEKQVPNLVNTVSGFADKVVDALNNASAEWANGTNSVILSENAKINNDVFGWVNTSTTTLNNTLNSFINETMTLINQTFSGTVLYEPISGVFECLIGLKVESIEKGLTWAQDNAHVTFPTFPNNTFSAGAQAAVASSDPTTGQGNNSFLANPGSDATDQVTATVVSLTQALEAGVHTEALIATAVLVCYLVVVLMGASRVLYLAIKRQRVRAEGGATFAGDIDPTAVLAAHHTGLSSSGGTSGTAVPPQHTGARSFGTTARMSEAPAYSASEKFAAFNQPMPGTDADASVYDWNTPQDAKVGYAGLRQPAGLRGDSHGNSVYGVLDDEKRGAF